ncbi:Protein CBG26582 [Caenorhabditis briggsae]|uniref:Protein CBG26582 n=1 Tax=Caenorhabditis briggsae TaxID=6238 RepID=B6IIE2_CAEBR|nr:Protein CBG26582 [Caenorhabditis briggsae]CAR99672.1 Protein CBG26582 [Caenorhabditis briggsae]
MWTVALRNVTDQFNIASTGKFMESANYLEIQRQSVSTSTSTTTTSSSLLLLPFLLYLEGCVGVDQSW